MSEDQAEYILRKYQVRKQVYEKSNGRCWYCGIELTIDASAGRRNHSIKPTNFAIDHFVAKNNGGNDDNTNLVPSCNWCNCQKKDMSIEDFREHMTRLKNHIPKFTDEQLYYLKEHSLSLPSVEPYIFYFEKTGL